MRHHGTRFGELAAPSTISVPGVQILHPNAGIAPSRSRFMPEGLELHYTVSDSVPDAIRDLKSRVSESMPGGASYHFVIDRNGAVHQLVPLNRGAIHGGVGDRSKPEGHPERTARVPGFNRNPNSTLWSIAFINKGYSTRNRPDASSWPQAPDRWDIMRSWEPYTEAQISSGARLAAGLLGHIGQDSHRIWTHAELTKDKHDPGPMFPLQSFKGAIDQILTETPAPPTVLAQTPTWIDPPEPPSDTRTLMGMAMVSLVIFGLVALRPRSDAPRST